MDKKDTRPFNQRHPKWNMFIGFLILLTLVGLAGYLLSQICYWIYIGMVGFVGWLSSLASKLDAVIIVALITATVSLVGVILSSIVSKIIDYKKNREEYLAQKREKPYGEFVDMVYKIQQNSKKPNSYTEEEMISDLLKFSKEITLWGSKKVVKKWVKFRENGANPKAAQENMFVMESIMNEMRKDLGLKRTKKGNLLSFFINDLKKSMKEMKK